LSDGRTGTIGPGGITAFHRSSLAKLLTTTKTGFLYFGKSFRGDLTIGKPLVSLEAPRADEKPHELASLRVDRATDHAHLGTDSSCSGATAL
jgi:hypothetical protein